MITSPQTAAQLDAILHAERVEFAKLVAIEVLKNYKPEPQETYLAIDNEEIYKVFPDLVKSTLKRWCMSGKVGKICEDGKYRVTIKELERFIFGNKKKAA